MNQDRLTNNISRRDTLKWVAAAGSGAGLLLAGSSAAARPGVAAPTRLDVDRFIRMRTSEDGAPVMWVYAGALIGKPEGQLAQPLVRVNGMSFTRAILRSPGVYDWELDEIGYYCDLKTNAVLETWTNPFTGALVKPAHYHSPEHLQYSSDGVGALDPLPPGTQFHGQITRLADVAGIAAMTEDLYVQIPAVASAIGKPGRPPRTLTSLASFTASAAALDGDKSQWIDAQSTYATMNTFASWLAMDGTPGVQNMRLAGRKCRSSDIAAIPQWLRESAEKDHPGFLDTPTKWRA
jgi:hypothetical protein